MAKAGKPARYDADSIDVNLGLDVVRKTPQLYIGNPDSLGLFYCAKEPLDNAIDEAVIQEGTTSIGVAIEKDGTVWTYDSGRGIPIETHKVTKISTLTTVMTTLSAGAKMRKGDDSAGYNKSRGVHGMGVSITNAMSTALSVWTFRNKQWYMQSFAKGKPTTKVLKCKAPKVPLAPKEQALRKSGTVVCFKFDPSVFDKGTKLDLKHFQAFLGLNAYLHPKVKIVYSTPETQKVFHQPKGLQAYAEKQLQQHEIEANGIAFTFQDGDVNVLLQWTKSDRDMMQSFVNGSPTKEGGRHVDGLLKAIADSIKSHAGKRAVYKPEDLRVGLLSLLNVSVSSPRFSTQTKEKLVTPEAYEMVSVPLTKALTVFWAKNKTLAKGIIARAAEIRAITAEFAASKKAVAALRSQKNRLSLSDKFSGSTTRDASKRELFIVEGDSAAGTAKLARDNTFQELLALRGKVLNPYGASGRKLLENKEVQNILKAIGVDLSEKGKKSDLRVGKIIVLADPDVDGKHITVLLLSVLQRIVPRVFKEGRVFVVDSLLFNAQHGGKRYFGASVEAVMDQLPKGVKLREGVQRIKGWGEASADALEQIAFDVKTRKITRVEPIDGDATRRFAHMLGTDASARRDLINVQRGAVQ